MNYKRDCRKSYRSLVTKCWLRKPSFIEDPTSQGEARSLSQSRFELQISAPKTKKEVWEFDIWEVGAAGYCCLWMTEFVKIARPLYTSIHHHSCVCVCVCFEGYGMKGTEPLIQTEIKQDKRGFNLNFGVMATPCDILAKMTGPCSHRLYPPV